MIVVAVRCKRLVDRDASLITTALMSLSFMAVRCQRLIVHVTMFCDGSFGVVAVRCQLLLCASLCFATAAFLSLIKLVDAPLVELIESLWVVADWPRLLASCFNFDATLGRYAVVMKD